MLDAVECLGDAAETVNRRVGNHGADEAVFFGGFKFGRIEQVNGDQSHFFAGGAKIVEFDFAVAPAAGAVVDVALEFGGRGVFRARHFGKQRRGETTPDGAEASSGGLGVL